jgi:hypothetical protein
MRINSILVALSELVRRQLPVLMATMLATGILAGAAEAQVCSPNLVFRGNASYTNQTSSGLQGTMYGGVYGRVQNGELTDFDLRFDPYVSGIGPYGLRLFSVNYNRSPRLSAPNYYCIPWDDSSVVMIIENVPTAELRYTLFGSAVSYGMVNVGILFTEYGPGQIIVDYEHNVWSKTPKAGQLPFWGRLINSSPQAGAKLSITNFR